MRQATNPLIGLALFLAVATVAFSQDGAPQPCPDVTGTLGCQLVAWSHLQEPVPLPESKPAPPADQQPGHSPDSQTEPQSSKQSITGIIVREGKKYVLKAGNNTTYQLDDQEKARHYQDQQVIVVGRLNTETNTVHVEGIHLTS